MTDDDFKKLEARVAALEARFPVHIQTFTQPQTDVFQFCRTCNSYFSGSYHMCVS